MFITLVAGVSVVAGAIKCIGIRLGALQGIAPSIEKRASRILNATAAINAAIRKDMHITAIASIGSIAAMLRLCHATMIAMLSVNGAIARTICRTLSASVLTRAFAYRGIAKVMLTVAMPLARMQRIASFMLDARIDAIPSLGMTKALKMLLEATVSILETVQKCTSKAMFASKRLASSMGKVVYKPLAIALQTVGSLQKTASYLVLLTAELPIVADFRSACHRFIVLAATLSARPFRHLQTNKRLSATIRMKTRLIRHWPMILAASLTVNAAMQLKFIARVLHDIARTVWAPLRKRIWKP
jgi:hypothetical protein